MKKILINYSSGDFSESQKNNSLSGKKFGFETIQYNRKDIDPEFYNKNSSILNNEKGAGYWLWKPYIILESLKKVNDNDIIFYMDSGSTIVKNLDFLIENCLIYNMTLFNFDYFFNKMWTKRDSFYFMGCDNKKYYDHVHYNGAFQIYKKCPQSLHFVNEYLNFATDKRIISDDPNICGLPNLPDFKEHRSDQSILSLLAAKHNIRGTKDPSQYGDPNNFYIYHHRQKK